MTMLESRPAASVAVGVSGTRTGMSPAQRAWFVEQAATTRFREFHYGDCVGVDVEAFWLLVELGGGGVLHAWPGLVGEKYRGGTIEDAAELGVIVHPLMPPLDRNQQIVDHADVLWAFPAEMVEQRRSGTWATIRRGRRSPSTTVIVVLPDGTVTE